MTRPHSQAGRRVDGALGAEPRTICTGHGRFIGRRLNVSHCCNANTRMHSLLKLEAFFCTAVEHSKNSHRTPSLTLTRGPLQTHHDFKIRLRDGRNFRTPPGRNSCLAKSAALMNGALLYIAKHNRDRSLDDRNISSWLHIYTAHQKFLLTLAFSTTPTFYDDLISCSAAYVRPHNTRYSIPGLYLCPAYCTVELPQCFLCVYFFLINIFVSFFCCIWRGFSYLAASYMS